MRKWYLGFLLLLSVSANIYANPANEEIKIRITDENQKPIFGVYFILKKQFTLLATSDMEGEGTFPVNSLQPSDTIVFQGIGYATVQYSLQELKRHPAFTMQELQYNLQEATATGISPKEILKKAIEKLQKIKAGRLPVCRYYGPAQYEKITVCRDTTVEYRREFGFYFTSGNVKAKNTWDETYRSYLVPQYIARSLNLTNNGSDTLSPMFLTYEDIRFDVGTRKIFTLLRAIQLFGPLFDGIDSYDIRAIDTEDPDYTFTFQTRRSAYPERTRISCKGTLIIDRENYYVKNMTFDYIDYQLLRQTLLTNRRKTSSPFSTHAQLTFVYDSCGQNYISSCHQQTTWKYNLGKDFILIEQPSRHQPGINRLIEKEAFHLFGQNKIKTAYQTDPVLVKIHLAQRYPTGKYDSAFFHRLPPLLDSRKAVGDLNHYMQLETQFRMNDGKTYYPDNYILTNKIDKLGQKNYRQNLEKARKELFLLFGDSKKYPCPGIPSP